MLGLSILLTIALCVALNWRNLKMWGESKWDERQSGLNDQYKEFSADRPSKRMSLGKPKARVIEPISGSLSSFHRDLPFESKHCETCPAAVVVQYKNNQSGSTFEFCKHHAKKNEDALKNKGFKVTLDGRR